MATNYWEDEDEDNDTDTDTQMDGTDLVKKLRKAKRVDEKRIKELTEMLDGFNKKERENIVKSILETKGVNPKAARLLLNDIQDITPETVTNWLDDNGDLFGLQQQQADPAQSLDRAALRQQDIVTQQAITPDRAADSLLRLNNAASAEEIIAMIHSGEF